ncbi:MAG: hypothetical protein EOM80_13840, partial [Erysipelotrichia bacterium]|nr:hypothetical protein [Erysipelotrichia bacterium]
MVRLISNWLQGRATMQNFMKYLKKRGFTLVEALIATVIAGYCILPVIGTLHSGLRQTENFDHREKLRVLARSRLNKELAAAAFNHTNIDKTTSYHYVYYGYPSTLPADTEANPPQLLTYDTALASDSFCPLTLPTLGGSTIATGYATVTQILYSYKVSVEVKEQLTIATTTKNITAELLHNLGGLKALVIKAEVEPNINIDSTLIDPLTLFSLLNVPSFGDEHLWVSNPSNYEIISVDPESRAAVANFSLADPTSTVDTDRSARNLAVNPNNKFVAYMGLKNIYALNIDRESPDYGNVKAIWSSSNTSVTNFVDTTTNKTEKAKAMLDRGIAFRPDGKYCFITYH